MRKKEEMIKPQDFADKIGKPYQTVMYWLRNDLIPGVEVIQESRGPVYKIPISAVDTIIATGGPKRGRPQKPENELKTPRRKKSDASKGN
jgi:hypothetical protein